MSATARAFLESHDSGQIEHVGTALAQILAEQHTRIKFTDVCDWLPREPRWPETRDWIDQRIGAVTNDATLIVAAKEVIDAYAELSPPESDCVLVHTDVGLQFVLRSGLG